MSLAPSTALERRHDAIRAALATHRADAFIVTALPNILYLTNFTGSAAIVVLTASRLLFLTDSRYVTVMNETRGRADECPGLELVTVEGSYDATLVDVLIKQDWKRVAFEAADLTVARHTWLATRLAASGSAPVDLIPTEGVVERPRQIKDEYEITTLREAARRLSRVAEQVPSEVKRGRTEREVAMAIDWRIRDAGFTRTAFETIVASGPNSALPHARPGERKLTEGDLVVLDFGGVYDSYCVDLTRTVSIGAASPRAREVYDAVLAAHDRAIAGRGAGPVAVRDRRGGPGHARRSRVWATRSATARATAWGSRSTRTRGSPGADRMWTPVTKRLRPAWCSRSSPARISPAGAASGSKTMCWSRRAGVERPDRRRRRSLSRFDLDLRPTEADSRPRAASTSLPNSKSNTTACG